MAVNTLEIPTGAVEQPTNTVQLSDSDALTFQRAFKGDYTTLETWCKGIKKGDILGAFIVKTFNLRRTPGDTGILTFSLAPNDTEEDEDGNNDQEPLDEVWSIHGVRNDVSILRYCGPYNDSPNRVAMELWLKETDKTLADANKYRTSDADAEGTDLTSAEQALADKFRAGFDSVMRVYILMTCKRTYSSPPAEVSTNLMTIDTPSPGMKSRMPGNTGSIISDHDWLKVQDDADEDNDGNWVRIESWMGVNKQESSWDEDFYGATNRWGMPYQHRG